MVIDLHTATTRWSSPYCQSYCQRALARSYVAQQWDTCETDGDAEVASTHPLRVTCTTSPPRRRAPARSARRASPSRWGRRPRACARTPSSPPSARCTAASLPRVGRAATHRQRQRRCPCTWTGKVPWPRRGLVPFLAVAPSLQDRDLSHCAWVSPCSSHLAAV